MEESHEDGRKKSLRNAGKFLSNWTGYLTARKGTILLNLQRTKVPSFRRTMYLVSSEETKCSDAAMSKEKLTNFCRELYGYMAK